MSLNKAEEVVRFKYDSANLHCSGFAPGLMVLRSFFLQKNKHSFICDQNNNNLKHIHAHKMYSVIKM